MCACHWPGQGTCRHPPLPACLPGRLPARPPARLPAKSACTLLAPSLPRRSRNRNFVYIHIQPQYQCLLTEEGGWGVDFIGRVEQIDEDFRVLLEEINKRRPEGVPPVGASWQSVRAEQDGLILVLAGRCALSCSSLASLDL